MQIFIKTQQGECIATEAQLSELVGHMAERLLTKQNIGKKYLPAMLLMFAGRKLMFDKTFEEERIQSESTLSQIFASEVIEMIGKTDPVTLDPIAQPLGLNPGYQHYFEATALLTWIQTQKQNGHQPSCPTCRTDINESIVNCASELSI